MAGDFLAGCLGGAAGVLVGHPFDTVKVRLQAQDTRAPQYKGIRHCFLTIIRKETPLGLFKGMASPLLGASAINAIIFGVEGNVMRQFDEKNTTAYLISGATAGAVQTVVCGPMELAKIRMQMEGIGEKQLGQTARYKGSVDAIKKIYRQEGLRGCYRGYTLTLVRDIPGFAVYFVTDDFLRRQFARMSTDGEVGIAALLVGGGLSGMSSWVISFAPDVMKTRIQLDGANGVNKYNGIIDVIRKSYRTEGAMVFTKGLGATLLRAFPVNAATFTVVRLTNQMLDRQATLAT